MPRHRPTPPLLPRVDGKPAIELFEEFFRAVDRAPIVGPEGRVVSFRIRKLWAYHAFVKTFQSSGHFGRPEQRFAWIEDTLRSPDGIWRRAGNPAVEFFVSYYTAERRDFFYAVKCNVFSEGDLVSIDPFDVRVFRSEIEWKDFILHAPPCWSSPDSTPAKLAPGKPDIIWSVMMHYGMKTQFKDEDSWTRHFRKLESNHPKISIVAVEPGEDADYWVLDTNTSDGHSDTGSFQAEARAAGAIPLAVNTPSNLVVKETDGRIYLFSMRMQARD